MKKLFFKKPKAKARNFLLLVLLCLIGATPIYASSISEKVITLNDELQSTVTGVVSDENGTPLPGASIVVQGTTTGAVADFDGNYSINVASDGVLVFSYVGYAQSAVPVNGRTTINISLQPDSSLLDEVVLVGYGTQKKGEVTVQ